MKALAICIVGLGLFLLAGGTASAQGDVATVVSADQVVISAPLSQGSSDSGDHGNQTHKPHPLPGHGRGNNQDDVRQSGDGSAASSRVDKRFPGVGANGSAPPDTNMAVGPNHILQTVNSRYAIFNKSGTLLVGPFTLSSIWAPLGSGNGCATNNGGDVVAQYDKLADRFIVTQLGGVSAPFSECIAISQTPDPAGAYWLYSFNYGTVLNDYPKFGIWPTATNSAYLATYNLFNNGQTFAGGQLCAYDRAKMLVGDPSAQAICFTVSGGNYLPADLDGSSPPLDGTPGLFLSYQTLSSLHMLGLAPNFSNPGASTLSVTGPDIPVASFTEACATTGDTCVPQPGTPQKLDALGDRLMYRLAFRNFGDHEAVVVNHSIVSGSSVGVRWYELRAPVSTGGGFALFQQGTYAPDATYRWMGSAAMDASGNIGIGYSASSSATRPSIRYTGRLASDPLGTMEAETTLVAGVGSQTGGLSRWGDYTAMRIDPSDDCTFWYTNEYLPSTGSFNWATAFGSFKFPTCNAPDFSISANPPSLTLTQGTMGTSTVTVTAFNGFSGSVALGVSGCPSGVTCSIASTTLTVTATSNATTGMFPLTITGTSGTLVHTTTVSLTVNAASTSINVALASNGGVVVPSSTYSSAYPANSTNNGDRKGLGWGNGGGWNDGTESLFPDVLEVDFSGTPTINEVDVFTLQDNYNAPLDPTPTMTFGTYGLRDFEVQYWTGNAWATIPSASVTGNNLVWRQFTFAPLVTSKIRVVVTATADGVYSRITEVEAYTNAPATPDFSISTNPSSLTLTQGGSGTSIITVTNLNGFSGNVTLGVSTCPSGVTCSIATSTLTVATDSSASTGTFQLTITGTSGALSHQATVSVTVNPAGGSINVALASNGGVAVASSTYSSAYPANSTNNGDRKGLGWGNGGGWNDGTENLFPDSMEVDFNGTPTINEVDVFTLQDNYTAPVDPTPTMTFSTYGLRDFEVQYWNGSAWTPIPGATVTGNNLVWRKFTFAPLATSKIRVVVTATADGAFSRITEIEAYTNASTTPDFSISANPPSLTLAQGGNGTSAITVTPLNGFSGSVALGVSGCPSGVTCTLATSTLSVVTTPAANIGAFHLTITGTSGVLSHQVIVPLTINPAGGAVNVALASNGGAAVASSSYFNGAYPPESTNNGDRKGLNWGNGGGWNDGTSSDFPDSLEVDFSGMQTINEVDVFTLQDNYSAPVDPTLGMTFSLYGIRDFEVQYWNGSAWAAIPGATVTGNNQVWSKFTFAAVTTSKIRVVITATADGEWSRITEIEAYTGN